jgi:transposase-like protein
MLDSARRLRVQARQFENRRKPTGTRYSPTFRAEVVTHAHAEVREGVAVARIARNLGLRPKTLTLWMRRMPASKLRAVSVEPDPRPGPMPAAVAISERRAVIVTPGGVRVEGLDLDEIVQLMRALA